MANYDHAQQHQFLTLCKQMEILGLGDFIQVGRLVRSPGCDLPISNAFEGDSIMIDSRNLPLVIEDCGTSSDQDQQSNQVHDRNDFHNMVPSDL